MNRRRFTKSLVAGSLASIALPRWLNSEEVMNTGYLDNIGIQLWTVRNQLAEDLPGTLKAIKDAGYAQVELMRTVGEDYVFAKARELGLNVSSAFIDWRTIADPTADGVPSQAEILEKAKDFGLKYLVFGYLGKGFRETEKQMTAHAESANAFGEKCLERGITLCYHHHSFEFAPLAESSKTGWDVLLDRLDPNLVKFEIDVFWAAIGGLDPVVLLKELEGRVAQVHLKDLLPGTGILWDEGEVPHEAFKELGNGELDIAKIIQVASETGVDQCHVEQDQSPNPLLSIATSSQYLRDC